MFVLVGACYVVTALALRSARAAGRPVGADYSVTAADLASSLERDERSSGCGCAEAACSSTFSTRVTTIRLHGGAADVRLAGSARPF